MPSKHREQSGYVVREPRGGLVDHAQLAEEIVARIRGEQGDPDCPTLKDFAPRFIEEYAKANRQKPRGVKSKESILRVHLLPRFGDLRLDQFRDGHIQGLKAQLSRAEPKTVNNVLSVLSKMLHVAVRWDVIRRMPVQIELLKVIQPELEFYEFEQYRELVEAASRMDLRIYAMVLLGGDAGLRVGEMLALRFPDIDHRRNLIHIQRSISQGHLAAPKGGKTRKVPMTEKLAEALCNLQVGLPRDVDCLVLRRDDGSPLSDGTLATWMAHAQRAAGLRPPGPVKFSGRRGPMHILRHTFCSHLAMRGAAPIAIQKLAGHQSLKTTERYMHLAPTEASRAIELLNQREPPRGIPGPPGFFLDEDAGSIPAASTAPGWLKEEQGLEKKPRLKRKKETRRDATPGGFLTVKDLAAFLGVPVAAVLALVEANQLAVVRIGDAIRFDRRAIDAFIAKGGAR